MPAITLGHIFLAAAAIELVFVLVFAARLRVAHLELPPERRSPAFYIIVAAAIVSSLALAILAFVLPEARMRLV